MYHLKALSLLYEIELQNFEIHHYIVYKYWNPDDLYKKKNKLIFKIFIK